MNRSMNWMGSLAFAILLTAPTLALAQGLSLSDEPLPTTDNAALVYWQAIASLPKWNDEQRRFVDGSPPFEEWLGETAEDTFATTETAMELMHHAAGLKQCDWGTNRNDGPAALLPHASKCRELTRMAKFRVLYQSRRGKVDEAVDDGLALLSLARHLSRDKLLNSTLTGNAIEAVGLDALAEFVPQLSPDQLHSLAERHAALPARPPIRECILSEKRAFLGWFARALKANGPDQVLDVIEIVASNRRGHFTGAYSDAVRRGRLPWLETLRPEVRDDPERLKKLIEQTAGLWDEVAKLADASAEELPGKAEKWALRLKDAHPLSAALLPSLAEWHASTIRVQARQAILQAGIAYCLDQKSGLQTHVEPFTGKPFAVQKFAGGFELHSDVTGDPLIVRFGLPPGGK